jgi:PAS domain S-box-containing protein
MECEGVFADSAPPEQAPPACVERQAVRAIDETALAASMRAAAVALVGVDREGRVQLWNAGAEQLFGWQAAEVLGRPLPILPPDAAADFQALLASGGQEKGSAGVPLWRRKDGTLVEVLVWTAPLADSRGTPGILGIYVQSVASPTSEPAMAARVRELEALRAVSEELAGDLHLATLLPRILRGALEVLAVPRGVVHLWEDAAQQLVPHAWLGFPETEAPGALRPGEGVGGTAALHRPAPGGKDLGPAREDSPPGVTALDPLAVLAAPLVHGDRLLGTLTLHRDPAAPPFTAIDQERLRRVARPAALAIANAHAYEALARRAKHLATLHELTHALTALREPEDVGQAILAAVRVLLPGTVAHLWEPVPNQPRLRLTAVAGLATRAAVTQQQLALGEGLAGLAAERRRVIQSGDVRTDPRFANTAWAQAEGVRGGIALPLVHGEAVGGALVVLSRGTRFTEEDGALLRALAGQATIALENARRYAATRQALADRSREAEALERYQVLADHARDIVLVLGPTGRILKANQAAQAAYGYTPAELRARGVTDLRAPDTPAFHVLPGPEAEREGLLFEMVHRRKDGQTFPVEVSTRSTVLAGERLYLSIVRDITERKEAEVALQARTRQLEAVTAVTAEITQELDLPMLLHLIATRASELLGAAAGAAFLWDEATQTLTAHGWSGDVSAEELSARRLGEGLVGAVAACREGCCVNDYRAAAQAIPTVRDHTAVTAALAEPLLYRERLLGVLALAHHGGTRQFAAAERQLLRLFADHAAIAVENARLFAELNDSYAALQRTQAELIRAEKLRALGQMAAGMAHDLNNTLAVVLGQAELLRRRAGRPDPPEGLDTLITAATDAAHVVRQLQDFARQAPRTSLEPLNLGGLVQEVIALTRPQWKTGPAQQGCAITVQLALADLPPILGNAADLREALINLIVNAVAAMPAGGTLTLTGRADPTEAGGAVELAVTDTGVGMAPAVRDRAFDPFFTTKGLQGTGLGLSLVYSTMERHGGRVSITSAPGEGTTVTLRFQRAPRSPDAPPPPAPAGLSARRVLLIDDDATVRTTVAALLQAAGHTVREAASGPDGLVQLAAHPVDLVVTDLGMPAMSGDEVARRVKAAQPALPVVLLTGWGDTGRPSEPDRQAVDRVLGKPVRLADLLGVVAELTARPPTGGTPPPPAESSPPV